jgi:hypothetical protein
MDKRSFLILHLPFQAMQRCIIPMISGSQRIICGPAFMYSFNRANEVALNIGLVKAAYQTEQVRGAVAFMAGTYANANLAAEPGVFKNVFEAHIGVKLTKHNALWLDAGIMPSHIGSESAIGMNHPTLSRSLMAENSPYYETGITLSYTSPNEKWYLAGLLLNGWQRIQRPDGNTTPAFGHQLTWKPNPMVTLNSSSFVGNDKPDSIKQMRYFHNFYGQFTLHPKWQLTAAFDIGMEQKSPRSNAYNSWYTPAAILRFQLAEKHFLAIRGEYYHDPGEVIIVSGVQNGFQTWGYSLNYDMAISRHLLWRTEWRGFSAKDEIFLKDGIPVQNNFALTTSFALGF